MDEDTAVRKIGNKPDRGSTQNVEYMNSSVQTTESEKKRGIDLKVLKQCVDWLEYSPCTEPGLCTNVRGLNFTKSVLGSNHTLHLLSTFPLCLQLSDTKSWITFHSHFHGSLNNCKRSASTLRTKAERECVH